MMPSRFPQDHSGNGFGDSDLRRLFEGSPLADGSFDCFDKHAAGVGVVFGEDATGNAKVGESGEPGGPGGPGELAGARFCITNCRDTQEAGRSRSFRAVGGGMRLEPYLRRETVSILHDADGRDGVLRSFAAQGAAALEGADEDRLYEALLEREAQMPTSTPEGVAFPHALLPDVEQTLVVVARLLPGVVMSNRNHPPIGLAFCFFGARERPWDHVRLLARLSRIVRPEDARKRLLDAKDATALYDALIHEDARAEDALHG